MSVYLLSLWLAFWGMLATRSFMLYRYKLRLLDQVSAAARLDIACGLSWEWRYDVLRSANPAAMWLMFWRSFDSFYPNRSFIKSRVAS